MVEQTFANLIASSVLNHFDTFFVFSVASIVVGEKVKTRIEHYDGKSKPDQVSNNQLFKYVSLYGLKVILQLCAYLFDQ